MSNISNMFPHPVIVMENFNDVVLLGNSFLYNYNTLFDVLSK